MYVIRVDSYRHFAVMSCRDLHIMNIDIAGSAESLVTVRLNIFNLEDANFHTNETFISHMILRVTDTQGFR